MLGKVVVIKAIEPYPVYAVPWSYALVKLYYVFLARVDSFLAQEAPLPNLSSAYSPVNSETFTQRLIPFLSGEANLRKRSVFVILAIFNLRIITYIALLFIITHICPKVDYMFKFLFD